MKDEKEINVSVAQLLGWKIEWPDDWKSRLVSSPGGKAVYRPSDPRIGLWSFIPDYESDSNTRPEMLASLEEEEIQKLVLLFFEENWPGGKPMGSAEDSWAAIRKLLELTQPEFARLFCKVKGLL